MSKDEKVDYSDYIQHLSTIMSTLSLLAGFTFTTTTILLTLLPKPSLLLGQVTLFLLVFLFFFLEFLIIWTGKTSIFHCRNLPKSEGGIESPNVFNLMFFASFILFGVVTLIMFLLFELFYLTLASAVVGFLIVFALMITVGFGILVLIFIFWVLSLGAIIVVGVVRAGIVTPVMVWKVNFTESIISLGILFGFLVSVRRWGELLSMSWSTLLMQYMF